MPMNDDTTMPSDAMPESPSLSSIVNSYDKEKEAYKMVEGEFRVDKEKVDSLVEDAKNDIFELLPNARDMLEALMLGAESEAIRWNATKFVLEFALKGGEADDGMARLLKSLTKDKKDKKPSPADRPA